MGVVLHSSGASVSVDPIDGGRITSALINGRERLRAKTALDSPISPTLYGCFLMVPWVGRLRDATLPFRGQTFRFEPNLGSHALHGVGFSSAWAIEAQSSDQVVLMLDLARTRWPFGGELRQTVTLGGRSIAFRAEVMAHDQAMPAALGWHPWFICDQEPVTIRLGARRTLATDEQLLPTGKTEPVNDETDLRTMREVGDLALDHVYLDAHEALLRWPDLELAIQGGDRVSQMAVCVRDGCVCIEPQSAWTDAPTMYDRGFSNTGLAILEPRQGLAAEQVWRW